MTSVRLHHPEYRNVTVVVEHGGRPYTQPLWCIHCDRFHQFKAYHLKVDSMGDVVVTEVIHDRLKEINFGGFKVLGPENNPEPIVLGLGGEPQTFDVVFQPTDATEGGGNG